jgi:hypothetical protein
MKMKYNKSFGENGRDFNEYIEYLKTIKNNISIELFKFLSDPRRHDFGEKSLHDSRIEKIHFDDNFAKEKRDLVITLLGENRTFLLYFFNVIRYKIVQNCVINDLLTYEVGLKKFKDNDEENQLVFRAVFDDGDRNILQRNKNRRNIGKRLII